MRQVLETLGLQEFVSRFIERGFNRVHDVFCLDDEDLAMLIPDEKKQANYIASLHKGIRNSFMVAPVKRITKIIILKKNTLLKKIRHVNLDNLKTFQRASRN